MSLDWSKPILASCVPFPVIGLEVDMWPYSGQLNIERSLLRDSGKTVFQSIPRLSIKREMGKEKTFLIFFSLATALDSIVVWDCDFWSSAAIL